MDERRRETEHHLLCADETNDKKNELEIFFHFFSGDCAIDTNDGIFFSLFSFSFSLANDFLFDCQTLTSTIKRPVGSPSMAMSKNTRGNPIFLLAKLRRHNWIKLDWLAKWFWFSVCRRPIECACRHSVPATREAIFLHVLRTVCDCVRVESMSVWMRKVLTSAADQRKVNRYERILVSVCVRFTLIVIINAFVSISMFRFCLYNRIQWIAALTPHQI